MFRKSIATIAAAAILATASFASTAHASDEGFEVPPTQQNRSLSGKDIAAGLAIGVIAGLLGGELKTKRSHERKSFKKRRNHRFCEDVPVRSGKRIVGFERVCN